MKNLDLIAFAGLVMILTACGHGKKPSNACEFSDQELAFDAKTESQCTETAASERLAQFENQSENQSIDATVLALSNAVPDTNADEGANSEDTGTNTNTETVTNTNKTAGAVAATEKKNPCYQDKFYGVALNRIQTWMAKTDAAQNAGQNPEALQIGSCQLTLNMHNDDKNPMPAVVSSKEAAAITIGQMNLNSSCQSGEKVEKTQENFSEPLTISNVELSTTSGKNMKNNVLARKISLFSTHFNNMQEVQNAWNSADQATDGRIMLQILKTAYDHCADWAADPSYKPKK